MVQVSDDARKADNFVLDKLEFLAEKLLIIDAFSELLVDSTNYRLRRPLLSVIVGIYKFSILARRHLAQSPFGE